MIKYQDVSIGKIISEIKSKNGEIKSMCLNPYNAVIITGHSNGTVCGLLTYLNPLPNSWHTQISHKCFS